jgi:microcystin-dependent protein
MLTFNGVQLGPLTSLLNNHIYVGDVSNQPADVAMSGDVTIINTGATTISNSAITNVKVSASATIALSKLASVAAYQWITGTSGGVLNGTSVTANRAVATDSNGLPIASSTTDTELGYVSGATSNIQAQINTLAGGATVPTGAIFDFGGTVPPTGYLVCDGSSLLRAGTYANLFAAIGTTWGSTDGTHFNIPALSRAVTVGSGGSGSGTLGNAVGNTGGAETVTVIQNSHNHTQDAHHHTGTAGGVASTGVVILSDTGTPEGTTTLTRDIGTMAISRAAAQSVAFVNTGTTTATNQSTTATNTASSVIQPSAVVLKIIKI